MLELEQRLDDFDPARRRQGLDELASMMQNGKIAADPITDKVNLHAHTFFSYNSYGYSPSRFAWLAKRTGLALAGIVDFDVFDGIDEFLAAAAVLDLKACGGMETRVFVPEFADKVMNSPGEPGISYHMGVGFPSGKLTAANQTFQQRLQQTAQQRNRELTARVNAFLRPVELDYDRDVLPLTPAGNATERHICLAYARKAAEVIGGGDALGRFWADKLGIDAAKLDLPEGRDFLNALRNKTMKRGGAGYAQPDAGAFPKMAETNRFVLAAGGIPTMTWLNGQSDGEKDIRRLIRISMDCGAAAINIIPDRNFTPGKKDELLANLQEVISVACELELPIVVGTEMNSPGQRFVDQFETAELSPFVPVFLKSARIVYAHSVLQRLGKKGYCSDWTKTQFGSITEKNRFFEQAGQLLTPSAEARLGGGLTQTRPERILQQIQQAGTL
jgi:hypothetical protein